MAQRHLEPAQPTATFALWRDAAQGLHGPELSSGAPKGPYRAPILQPILRWLQLHEAQLIFVSSHSDRERDDRQELPFLSEWLGIDASEPCSLVVVLFRWCNEHMSFAEGC